MSGKILRAQAGFTLIEVMVVIGLFAVMMGLTAISINRPQAGASLDGVTNVLVADLNSQRAEAMAGDSGSGTTSEPHSVRIQPTVYTLFRSATYAAGAADNYDVTMPTGVTLATTLPSSQVVFGERSGEVAGYVNGSNTITVTHTSGLSKVITINALGTVTTN